MKKILALFAVLAVGMTLVFTSCSFNSGMQTLSEDQITSDWVDGNWSGTCTITVNETAETTNIESQAITADFIKALYSAKGSLNIGDVASTKVECIVQANLGRTKMYIKQTVTATLLGTTTTTVTEYQLTKD